MIFVFFFFFKQKTAYEMRISDWSSDVCSSDLDVVGEADHRGLGDQRVEHQRAFDLGGSHAVARDVDDVIDAAGDPVIAIRVAPAAVAREIIARIGREIRSEERRVGEEWVRTCRSWWSPYH